MSRKRLKKLYDSTIYNVSKETGFDKQTLYGIKSGKLKIEQLTIKKIKKIANVYNCSVDDVLEWLEYLKSKGDLK